MSYVRDLRRLADPTQVPSVPVRLIDGHPLRPDATAYVPGAPNGGARDYCGIGPVLTPGAGNPLIGGSQCGPGLLSAAANQYWSGTLPPSLQLLQGTLFWSGGITGSRLANGTSADLYGALRSDGTAEPYEIFCLCPLTISGNFTFFYNISGVEQFISQAYTAPASGLHSYAASFSFVSSIASLFVDGVAFPQQSLVVGSPTFSSPTLDLGGIRGGPASNTISCCAYLYSSPLASLAVQQLHAEPFCMFERAGRVRLYYPLSGISAQIATIFGPFSAAVTAQQRNGASAVGIILPSASAQITQRNSVAGSAMFVPIADGSIRATNTAEISSIFPLSAVGRMLNGLSGGATLGPFSCEAWAYTGVIPKSVRGALIKPAPMCNVIRPRSA